MTRICRNARNAAIAMLLVLPLVTSAAARPAAACPTAIDSGTDLIECAIETGAGLVERATGYDEPDPVLTIIETFVDAPDPCIGDICREP